MKMNTELSMGLRYRISDVEVDQEGSWSYDDEMDGVISIIMDACEALSKCPGVEFVVTGFAATAWPVDVSTDLSIVLEQVPDALQSLRNGIAFSIGFYEQGIERVMSFEPNGELWTVECVDMNVTPPPQSELPSTEESATPGPRWATTPILLEVTRDRMETLLRMLAVDFLILTACRCPELFDHPWLQEWKRQVLSS